MSKLKIKYSISIDILCRHTLTPLIHNSILKPMLGYGSRQINGFNSLIQKTQFSKKPTKYV